MKTPHPWPGIVFLLIKAPRSAHELEELTGAGYDTVRNVLKRLKDEGLADYTDRAPARGPTGRERLWAWNPK